MVNIPNIRPPTTPGEMLREEFLEPMGLTQQQLANEIGVSNKRGITTSTALRLGKYFGTSPDFWLNLQRANDLYAVLKKEQDEIDKIQPLSLSREK